MRAVSLKKPGTGKQNLKNFLHFTIVAFFIITIVAIATPKMSNGTNNAIFGSFDPTGGSIILIGFPWLCLQYLKYHQGYF